MPHDNPATLTTDSAEVRFISTGSMEVAYFFSKIGIVVGCSDAIGLSFFGTAIPDTKEKNDILSLSFIDRGLVFQSEDSGRLLTKDVNKEKLFLYLYIGFVGVEESFTTKDAVGSYRMKVYVLSGVLLC